MTCSRSRESSTGRSARTRPRAVGPTITAAGPDGGELALRARAPGCCGLSGHRDQAGAEHRQVGHDEVPVVAAGMRDPVARLEAEADEAARGPRHLLAQLAVGRDLGPG